ncbi:hypothetical protein B0H13DRAFT_2127307 [Mycena leptocephala]|nr:hypothetical protein B0H13DRAFT_2127307 [Mycena leptocephala]
MTRTLGDCKPVHYRHDPDSKSSDEESSDEASDPVADTMSHPEVGPSDEVLDKFWKRVQEWNKTNRTACSKCINSKTGRQCVIDEDHPSCRSCRDIKIGCDRKLRFVFDLTKDEYFPDYDKFLSVFQKRDRSKIRKLKQAENTFRTGIHSKDALNSRPQVVELNIKLQAAFMELDMYRKSDHLPATQTSFQNFCPTVLALVDAVSHLVQDISSIADVTGTSGEIQQIGV